MMSRRLALLAAIAALSAVAVPSHAAKPKVSCLMLSDAPGDAKIAGQGSSYDADDVLSADLATGSKTLVAVLRLKSGDDADGVPTGGTYTLSWVQKTSKGTTQPQLSFYVYATGEATGELNPDATPGTNNAASSVAATWSRDGVITWTVPRKQAGLLPGAKLSGLTAASRLAVNYHGNGGDTRGSYLDIDKAAGAKSYVDRQPSCVRAS